MKNFYVLSFLVLFTFCVNAQILPVEQLNEVSGNVQHQIEGVRYVKDVNGVLNKYLGRWKASFPNGGELELVIKKYTRDLSLYVQDFHPEPLFWDELIGKYKITDQNGEIVENTLNLDDDSDDLIIKHKYYDENTYTFSYLGKNHTCGDNGFLFLYYQNDTTLFMNYIFMGETDSSCKSQAEKSLPLSVIVLTKQ